MDIAGRLQGSDRIDVRLHNSPAVFRLLIFDDDLFLLFYSTKSRAVDNQVYRCPVFSELYRAYERYFDLLYKVSSPTRTETDKAEAAS